MNQASNRLTWIFGIALVIALMAIAFLLGRDSKSESSATPLAEPHIERKGDQITITNDAPTEARIEERAGDVVITDQGGSVAEVVAYFAKVDRIQAGPTGVSPDAYAQELAAEAARGNAKGLDQLEGNLVQMESELRAIAPPGVCKEFHELTLSTVADARGLMKDLQRALSGDASNATALAARAQAAQEKNDRLAALRKSIEKSYGLAR